MSAVKRVALAVCTAFAATCGAAELPEMKPIFTVPHEFDMLVKAGHIQGLACSEKGIYLSHKVGLAKIGWGGKLIKHVDAPAHLGGIAFAGGKVYGSFIIRSKGNMKDGKPGMLRVWDEDLNVLEDRPFAETSGCVGVLGDTIYYAIGYGKEPHRDCSVRMLGLDFSDKGLVPLDLGYDIKYGIQAISSDGKWLVLVSYGGTSVAEPSLKNTRKINCRSFAEGIALVPKSIAKRDRAVFIGVSALGGNMQGWRKDPVNNPPRLRLDFYEFDGEGFSCISGGKMKK
jgi:hypothetical protein